MLSTQLLTPDSLRHTHRFDEGNPLAEKNTLRVAVLTAVMMVVEITGGWYYNSMALLADGWHMSSHTVALGLSLFAYVFARKYAHDSRFSFGTWKIEVLGGYTSAIFLVMVAGLMIYQSLERLISPSQIHYDQAIAIAIVGLLVNLASAWLLKDGHHHHHDHEHEHHDHHGHHDLNLRSAYMHVLADAATSVLAIIALFGGKLWGISWLDPVMGLVGAVLVSVWAYSLLRDTGRVLLDAEMNAPVVAEIRDVIDASPVKARLCDLHVWRVGKGKYACILSLATDNEASPEYFKQQLSIHEELVHISIEINRIGGSRHELLPLPSDNIIPSPCRERENTQPHLAAQG
jgi:cation diffusion facilitator family transporter